MVLDFYEDRILFSNCMKVGIDGYILANIDSEDIGYAVKQLSKDKKYYDAELIESYIHMLFRFCPPTEQSSIPNPLINDLIAFIEDNLNSEITITTTIRTDSDAANILKFLLLKKKRI